MIAARTRLFVLFVIWTIFAYQDDVVGFEELVARLVEHYAILARRWRAVRCLEKATQLSARLTHNVRMIQRHCFN